MQATQTKSISLEIVKQSAIALSVTAAYMLLCNINPATAFVGVSAWTFIASLRLSNLLRPLVLAFPAAAFGIAMGSYLFNVQSGKIAFGVYAVMPVIMLGIGLFIAGLSKLWGRSILKDLSLTALYGLLSGLVVSMNIVALAVIFKDGFIDKLLTSAVLTKVGLHVAISLAGYPILRLVERTFKHEEDTSRE